MLETHPKPLGQYFSIELATSWREVSIKLDKGRYKKLWGYIQGLGEQFFEKDPWDEWYICLD